ncbi:uncharacterized protein LOC120327145 [Styela clava]
MQIVTAFNTTDHTNSSTSDTHNAGTATSTTSKTFPFVKYDYRTMTTTVDLLHHKEYSSHSTNLSTATQLPHILENITHMPEIMEDNRVTTTDNESLLSHINTTISSFSGKYAIGDSYGEWLFCYSMTAVFLAITFYLLIAFVVYQKKTRFADKGHERDVKGSRFIDIVLLLSILGSIVRLILDFWTEVNCEVSLKVNLGLGGCCLSSVYLMLWRRQRFLYAHKSMMSLASPIVNILSWLTLVFLLLTVVVNFVFFVVLPIEYQETEDYKCEFGKNNLATIKWAVLAASSVTFQSILLGLFMYPLCAHEKKMKDANINRPVTSLRALLKRVLVTAIICIVSDVIVAAVASLIKRPTGEIKSLAYTFDIAINLVCIICSFSNWRQRLFPFNMATKLPTKQQPSFVIRNSTIESNA